MPREHYDLAVAGLGAMGSAVAYQAAKSGARVLGLDRHRPPHSQGSTHGDTRITRLAISEGSQFAPLVTRSHQIWRDIEEQAGVELLAQCGGLVVGDGGFEGVVHRTVEAARRFGIEHDELTSEQVRARYPQFNTVAGEQGYFEPSAGFVRPEAAVRAQLELARRHGAVVRSGERIVSYDNTRSGVTIATDRGGYHADTLVVAVGPWINEFFDSADSLFEVHRQILYWFDVDPVDYERYRDAPVFIWDTAGGPSGHIYGFPAVDGPRGGIKLASENYNARTTPDTLEREVTELEVRAFYQTHVRNRLAGVTDRCIRAVACMYTVTPDRGFLIDRHPRHHNIVVVSPCSGRGFKHSAAIGEAVAQLATEGTSTLDLSAFTVDRFPTDPRRTV